MSLSGFSETAGLQTFSDDDNFLSINLGADPNYVPRELEVREFLGKGGLRASALLATPTRIRAGSDRTAPWVMEGQVSGTITTKNGENTVTGNFVVTAGRKMTAASKTGPLSFSNHSGQVTTCAPELETPFFKREGEKVVGTLSTAGELKLQGGTAPFTCVFETVVAGPGQSKLLDNSFCVSAEKTVESGGCQWTVVVSGIPGEYRADQAVGTGIKAALGTGTMVLSGKTGAGCSMPATCVTLLKRAQDE